MIKHLGETTTKMAMLDLINAINCRKLSTIFTGNGTDGREACTTPPQNISSLFELREKLSSLADPNQPYRTLMAEVQGDIEDIGTITIPTNRGVSIYAGSEAADGTLISAAHFNASWLAELYLDGIALTNSTRVSVEEEGLVEISSCVVSHESASPFFLTNEGQTVFTSVDILGYATLQNKGVGFLLLTYVEFLNKAMLKNSGEIHVCSIEYLYTFSSSASLLSG